MAPFAQTLLAGGLLLALVLTAIAIHAYRQTRNLYLPISQVFAGFSVVLPIIIVLSTKTLHYMTQKYPQQMRPVIYLAVLALQLIYETVMATLALTYLVPGKCALEEQWQQLYRSKNGAAIRAIQDRLECCGFRSVQDRAWPFQQGRPEDGRGTDQCVKRYDRSTPCVGPWSEAERYSAGLFFAVAGVIFVVKVALFVFQSTRLTRPFQSSNGSTSHPHPRRLLPAESNQDERYRDDVEGSVDISIDDHPNGIEQATGRTREELSALLAGSEQWREGQ